MEELPLSFEGIIFKQTAVTTVKQRPRLFQKTTIELRLSEVTRDSSCPDNKSVVKNIKAKNYYVLIGNKNTNMINIKSKEEEKMGRIDEE
jgi:ribosomal protein L30/L7E